MTKINIAWAWWWTWGHVFPIKSLIQYLQSHEEFKKDVNTMVWFWKNWSLEEENYEQLKKNITNLYFLENEEGRNLFPPFVKIYGI